MITTIRPSPGAARSTRPSSAAALKPKVVLTAIDSDVIKTYVAMGLGSESRRHGLRLNADTQIGMLDASHLFESSTTRIGILRNAWLRGYVYAFIELFAPHLSKRMVEAAIAGGERSGAVSRSGAESGRGACRFQLLAQPDALRVRRVRLQDLLDYGQGLATLPAVAQRARQPEFDGGIGGRELAGLRERSDRLARLAALEVHIAQRVEYGRAAGGNLRCLFRPAEVSRRAAACARRASRRGCCTPAPISVASRWRSDRRWLPPGVALPLLIFPICSQIGMGRE